MKNRKHSRLITILLSAVLLATAVAAPVCKAAPFSASAEKKTQKVRMNFQNADIQQIVAFLQDISGRIIIADGDLKGTITVACDSLLPAEEAMDVLNSALKAKGYTMIQSGEVIRIVSAEESKQTNVPTRIGDHFEDLDDSERIITQVVPLTYIDAAKVRADLKALVGKNGELLNNAESNSIIITDTSANTKRLLQIIDFLDRESPRQTQIKVYNLDYAKAKELAALIGQLPKSTGGESASTQSEAVGSAPQPPSGRDTTGALQIAGELTVLADERSNSLIVATAPQNFPAIEKLIESLDRMLPQVMIEVVIMEASLDTTTKLGMEWSIIKNRSVSGEAVTGNFSTDWNIAGEDFGLKSHIFKQDNAFDLLSFLMKQQERINILSTPMILTSDNQEASITVGSEVPYLKETRRSVGDTKDYVYEYKNVGINLKVTPHINEQRYVVLDIHQEIKKLGPQTLFDAFMIITREADASLVIKDAQTVVLGGLMRDDTTTTKNSVPVLGKLPIVGKVFRNKETIGEKTELLVFITPHVVTSNDEIRALTNKNKERMKSLEDLKSGSSATQELKEENKQP